MRCALDDSALVRSLTVGACCVGAALCNCQVAPTLTMPLSTLCLVSRQVRDLIYREILEYHPQMLADHLSNGMSRGANFMYPSAVDNFRRQCASRHQSCDECLSWPPSAEFCRVVRDGSFGIFSLREDSQVRSAEQ